MSIGELKGHANRFLTGAIDVGGITGKFRLLVILVLVHFVFNWTSIFNEVGWRLTSTDYKGSPFIAKKIERPFAPLDTTADPYLHFEKIAFRFVPFAIANVLHLDERGIYYLQVALGFVFPLLVWKALRNATGSTATATSGAILVSGLYCGFAFFYDDHYFDAFAYLFLLLAMLGTSRPLAIFLCLCAAFTDERSVIAAGLVFIWHWRIHSTDSSIKGLGKHGLWYAAFVLLYFVLRFVIGSVTGLQTGKAAVGISNIWFNMPQLVLLVWSVFEGGWLLVFYAAYVLLITRESNLIWATAFFVFVIFFAGLLVGDSIRSQQYAFPALLIALAVLGTRPVVTPMPLQKLSITLTLVTPITIYLGGLYSSEVGHYVHNMYLLKPAYIYIPYLLLSMPLRHSLEYILGLAS